MAGAANLTEMFTALGVRDPSAWARSQESEGINQLARATILVELATSVRSSTAAALAHKRLPSPALAEALAAIRAAGISDDTLKLVMAFGTSFFAFDVLALLDGSSGIRTNPGKVQLALALGEGQDDPDFELADLGLHESWGEVVTAVLGKDVYWW